MPAGCSYRLQLFHAELRSVTWTEARAHGLPVSLHLSKTDVTGLSECLSGSHFNAIATYQTGPLERLCSSRLLLKTQAAPHPATGKKLQSFFLKHRIGHHDVHSTVNCIARNKISQKERRALPVPLVGAVRPAAHKS